MTPIGYTEFIHPISDSELAEDPYEILEHQTIDLVLQTLSSLACKIQANLSKQGGSNCFSPLSLLPVIAMIVEGMGEEERKGFLKSLGLESIGREGLRTAFKKIINKFLPEKIEPHFSLQTIQGLVTSKTVYLGFFNKAKQEYNTEIFECLSEDTCHKVNAWIKTKTKNKIPEFLSEVPDVTALILNALYFRGSWSTSFDEELTQLKPFYFNDGSSALVPMMHLYEAFFMVSHFESFTMLTIPFDTGMSIDCYSLDCYIFLPKNNENLDFLVKQLDLNFINECQSKASQKELRLQLPKFKMHIKIDNLIPHIEGLYEGLPLPEIASQASLGGAVHQAALTFDEKGVDGAAGSGGWILDILCENGPEDFIVDHPFAVVIKCDDIILLQGSVNNKDQFCII